MEIINNMQTNSMEIINNMQNLEWIDVYCKFYSITVNFGILRAKIYCNLGFVVFDTKITNIFACFLA